MNGSTEDHREQAAYRASVQCRAITGRSGERCKRAAVEGAFPEFCATHRTMSRTGYVPRVPGWAVKERSEGV